MNTAPPDPEKALVFVSHSSRNKVIADAICARLEQHGIRCWIAPRDIDPGRDYSDRIVGGASEIERDGNDFLRGSNNWRR